MNRIYFLIALVFAFTGCNCQKQAVGQDALKTSEAQPIVLVYQANTRGFFQQITLTGTTVLVSAERNSPNTGTTTTLSQTDASQLWDLVNKLDLEALPTYKDPTQKRFYDGAAIAYLQLTKNGKTYRTVDFDHGYPPVEIEKIVHKITSYAKKEP